MEDSFFPLSQVLYSTVISFLSVSILSALPTEIAGLLSAGGCPLECFYGSIDVNSGYALVVTLTDCYVWSYKQKSSPTIYTFQMPEVNFATQYLSTNEILENLPIVSIVPIVGSKEVGILASTPKGEFRYWESITYGLTNPHKYKSMRIYLAENDKGTCLVNCEPAGLIYGTRMSHLYRVLLTSTNGQVALSYSPLIRPLGVFARMSSLLGYTGSDDSSLLATTSEIVAVCAGVSSEGRHSRDIYVLTSRSLQKWIISKVLPEKHVSERDILSDISEALESLPVFQAASDLIVDLLDVAFSSECGVIVLTSISVDQEAVSTFGLFSFELDNGSGNFVLTSQKYLNHRATLYEGITSKPRLALTDGGPGAFVLLNDCIVATTLLSTGFEEVIPLRNPSIDRIIGFGTDRSKIWSRGKMHTCKILALCTHSGFLDVALNMDKLDPKRSHEPTGKAEIASSHDSKAQIRQLKNRLEQAVFFGSHRENPLSFNLAQESVTGLDSAALALSGEILQYKSKYIPEILEVKVQLQERLNRMGNIIKFINSSHLLYKLSAVTRHQLCWDCEKLTSAVNLWYYQNTLLNRGYSGQHAVLLTQAIERFMKDRGVIQQDSVKAFFKLHVSEIGLIPQTAYAYRREHSELYDLNQPATTESWTCQDALIDMIHAQFQYTEKVIKEFSLDAEYFETGRPGGFQIDADRNPPEAYSSDALLNSLKDQLCELADILFQVFTERIDFLSSDAENEDSIHALASLKERYRIVRSKVTLPLVTLERREHALQLAERYQDFRTLVQLSISFGGETEARIDYYINKFKEPFAFELYSYYLENGLLYQLMAQKDFYCGLLDKFLEKGQHTNISWLHDIHIGKYAHASDKLLSESEGEKNNLQKKTMLSLAKLSFLATVEPTSLDSENVQETLERMDDTLDLVTVHEVLRESYQAIIDTIENLSHKGNDQAAYISAINTGELYKVRPAMEDLYRQVVKGILDGQVLDSESLIDALTLPQNLENQVDNYRIALGVYRRAKDIPEDRMEYVLRTIWRRVILRDSWDYIYKLSAHAGDEELLAALKDTAIYCTLAAAHDGDFPVNMYLQPAETHFHTSKEDVITRFINMLDHQINMLIQDYQSENRQLDQHIAQHNLLGFYNEIVRLIQSEFANNVTMDTD
ncbi:hypothetical protein K493DRAFT_336490 [Basidiobolus meristosporus CBS 931.73]|uniref:Nucleoporin Nup133/Nup155-like C-terminal domain-containing protein n=1 Tax=Basidiobolus meristosporus CBS 931.73 TaxID=1314790 RepID=A0A1Y1YI71_9FUNG|nr:hypothetical protein K493DRAFT_336490 [Basidiobolus meristosporus CBS 931.73]|eukprot:ORX97573.1 hypothetical protein K493DRAFT_336490 [Basidiobolus meristosporus CBS 931.73]